MANTPSSRGHLAAITAAAALVTPGLAGAQQVAAADPTLAQRQQAAAAKAVAEMKAEDAAPKPIFSPQIVGDAQYKIGTQLIGRQIPIHAVDEYLTNALLNNGLPVRTPVALNPPAADLPGQASFRVIEAGSLAPHTRDSAELRMRAYYAQDGAGRVTEVKLMTEVDFNNQKGEPGRIAAMAIFREGHKPEFIPAFVDPRKAQPDSPDLKQQFLGNANNALDGLQVGFVNHALSESAPANYGPIAKVVPPPVIVKRRPLVQGATP